MEAENRKHYLAGVLAFTIWGFFSIALRAVKDHAPGEILFFRILFSFIVVGLLIATVKRNSLVHDGSLFKSLTRRQQVTVASLTLAGSLLLTVNWLTYIYVVNEINVKTASFSYLVCPVLTAILGNVLLSERLTALQWLAVFLCAVSCVLIGLNSTLELGYSLFTAISYALYLISQRKLQGFDRMVLLGIQVLFSLVILTLSIDYLVEEIPSGWSFYILLVVIAIGFTVVPLYLNLYALNRINSATIGILMYINPLINFLLALTLFGESINALQILGYIVIAVALVLFNIPTFHKIRNSYRVSRGRA